jgi:hypothetical protein
MNKDEVQQMIKEALAAKDAGIAKEIIESDEFASLRGDIAEKYQNQTGNRYPWEVSPIKEFVESELVKLISRGMFKDHPNWGSHRQTIIQKIKNQLN